MTTETAIQMVDWQSESDLDSIRNSCDVSIEIFVFWGSFTGSLIRFVIVLKSLFFCRSCRKRRIKKVERLLKRDKAKTLQRRRTWRLQKKRNAQNCRKRKFLWPQVWKANCNIRGSTYQFLNLWRRINFFRDQVPAPRHSLQYGHLFCIRTLLLSHWKMIWIWKKVDIGSQKETIPLNIYKSMFDVGIFY